MVEIKVRTQINATTEKVWNIISNINDDPKFWKGTTAIRNLAKDDNLIIREVTIGKVGRCSQTVTLFPKEGIHIRWTKGFIAGTKDLVLVPMGNATQLEVVLEYKLSGMATFMSGKITKDLQREADEAVRLIKEKAEGKMNTLQMEERKSWADLVNEKHPSY
jgi:carbon monoxide dehydrogenase subunit G